MFCFNGIIACMYGVEEAVFIHSIYWWTRQNEKNGSNYRDGRNWTYNSVEALSELLPFWTKRQIERITKKLVESGALITANYNKKPFDRTKWYALTETVLSIYANSDMEPRKQGNGTTQTVTPIPVSNPVSNPVIENGGNARTRFIKPALEEIRAYCAERRNRIDPQAFLDFYESNGWRVGRTPMADWKAAVRTWESREKQFSRKGGSARDPARTAGSSINKDALDAFIDGQFSGEGGT